MSTAELTRELDSIGRQLGRWQAELQAAGWAAATLLVLWAVCLSDLLVQFNRAGRLIGWIILVGVVGAGIAKVVAALRARRSAEAVAARIEQKFPQLDNHLINYVQFARTNGDAPADLHQAYLRRGLPEWQGLDFAALKDRRRHRRALIALGIALLVAALPFLWTARGWSNSLARVLNPFSERSASTLARLIEVTPGHSAVIAGRPVVLTCKAEGQRGQEVWIDIWPADDDTSSVMLGELGGETEAFSYPLSKVTSALAYRFRAGDARSEKYQLEVLPQLALTTLQIDVQSPAYTAVEPRRLDALAGSFSIPHGSDLTVTLAFNRMLKEGQVTVGGRNAALAEDGAWRVTVPGVELPQLTINGTDAAGETFESTLRVELIADRPPSIRVLAPTERVSLAPGAAAVIRFDVTDDYNVSVVRLETEQGQSVEEWEPAPNGVVAAEWTGEPGRYRVVATDARRESRSPLIVFDVTSAQELVAAQTKTATQTAATLSKLVALQRENLERTAQLQGTRERGTTAQWKPAADAQREIRVMAGRLMADPRKPLGALGGVVAELHGGAMLEVVDVLDLIPGAEPNKQSELGLKAVALETTILRVLTAAKQNYNRVEQHRRISDILAMIDALVSGEESVVKQTAESIAKPPPIAAALIARQDRLAGDTTQFATACRAESQRLKNSDAEFAALILTIAEACAQRQVAADMLRAAELLEGNRGAEAGPLQQRALAALQDFQKQLNAWRVAEARQTMDDVKQVVADAKKKFEKLVDLQTKVVESMRAVEAQEDLSDADKEQFMEELNDVKANIKDAALKIADDLHIFPELPVGNELVQDIQQVFEEATQVPGSESVAASELGLQKEDFMLEAMEQIKERFDDMEMWLTTAPDATKRLTENFDQTEMPKMAVIPLPEELEDIIGELMEQQEEIANKSDDSATNQAIPDMPMGWDIAEGEWSTFSAKGKSGNERPEHKDQDGRSLVGREGMSDGETSAGHGKINEGDKKIEARRTRDSAQAGQVAEEDHTDAKATGGGKLSGWDDEMGMSGEGPRRDANLPPSIVGMQAMLRRNAEAIYARATMLHIRTGSLDEAVRAVKDAEDAMQKGQSIERVREFQRRASAALEKAQTDLAGGYYAEALPASATPAAVEERLTGVPDEAPADYRDLVAEYFKSLSGGE